MRDIDNFPYPADRHDLELCKLPRRARNARGTRPTAEDVRAREAAKRRQYWAAARQRRLSQVDPGLGQNPRGDRSLKQKNR